MTWLLCLLFFLSGAAALIFENLWFRQAGLALGNSVWASSLVLAGFMGGLALGNGLVGRFGHHVRRPVRFYALLEVIIGLAGLTLVHLLPLLTPTLATVLRPWLEEPWLLNPLRLGIALALLLAPSTAMGATLPLLVGALYRRDPHFGRVLGRLYGWNTLGAVAGALAGEAFLVGWLGIRGSALFAGAVNLTAALLAFALARSFEDEGRATRARAAPLSARALGLLAAALLCGGILLALEVVWFRFLLLFSHGSSLAFAVMLAVVLAGIGLGGLLVTVWLSRVRDGHRQLPALCFASGVITVASYAFFELATRSLDGSIIISWPRLLELSVRLMLPVSLLSGVLFTLLGEALHREAAGETRVAGLLTLANTTGAMLGSLAGGFLLLPGLGIERSLHGLAAGYGLAAILIASCGRRPVRRREAIPWLATGAALLVAIGLFPSGLMERSYLRYPVGLFARAEGAVLQETREGLTETILYLRIDRLGAPLYHRLLTNGHSMSATSVDSLRYMKLFVYWPVAVHPDPRHALLISYGVGGTAKALTDTRSLETIDVVDVSADILEMSRIVYPDPAEHPLRDPRVTVHVEDGRYFLQTTERRFDLITGEPPPPKSAGIVNLYTKEYFDLVHERLADGGIATYWLPVHHLLESDSKAIIRAFCDVFADCSLWVGSGLDWLLIGTRDALGPVSTEHFARQWSDPVVGPELRAVGFELPEQLGALFMADAEELLARTADTLPLDDDHPNRLSNRLPGPREVAEIYSPWMNPERARDRFARSPLVRRLWPESIRQASLEQFDFPWTSGWGGTVVGALPSLHRVLTGSSLQTLPLWLMGSGAKEQQVARRASSQGRKGAALAYHFGVLALAERQYERAAEHLSRAEGPRLRRAARYLRIYALCMAGRVAEAETLAERWGIFEADAGDGRIAARFLSDTFGLGGPSSFGSDPRGAEPRMAASESERALRSADAASD
jgi:predicted membrane-bound spermidine synthase